jgi:hypothetical protein
MELAHVVSAMDPVLKPVGFRRRRQVWNRHVGGQVHAIDLQVSKSLDAFTVNVGALDPAAYRTCWGEEPPQFPSVASCTVQRRLSMIAGDRDKWWQADDPNAPIGIAREIKFIALPFLDRMRDRARMLEALEQQISKDTQPYPPHMISLAVLRAMNDDHVGACEALDRRLERPVGAWRDRIIAVRDQLGCGNGSTTSRNG